MATTPQSFEQPITNHDSTEIPFAPWRNSALVPTRQATSRQRSVSMPKPWLRATARQKLINKGVVWSQRHGKTAFSVPMFNQFMKRQLSRLEKHISEKMV